GPAGGVDGGSPAKLAAKAMARVRLAVVSRHAGSGHWHCAGRRAIHGGPLHLYSEPWLLCRRGLGPGGISPATGEKYFLPARARRARGLRDADHLPASILAGQHPPLPARAG